jgi:hypothetical protein
MRRNVSFSEEVLWRLEQSEPAAPPFTDCFRFLVIAARVLSECMSHHTIVIDAAQPVVPEIQSLNQDRLRLCNVSDNTAVDLEKT